MQRAPALAWLVGRTTLTWAGGAVAAADMHEQFAMTSDVTRSSGTDAPEPRRETSREVGAVTEPHAAGVRAASKFVGRVSQLDAAAVRAAVHAWRDVMRTESEAWFAAERAAAHAVLSAGRTAEQEILLGHLADAVLRTVWYRAGAGHTPEARVGATEASGQYIGSIAVVALLVRDHLTAPDFALLYRPFAAVIRLDELGPE